MTSEVIPVDQQGDVSTQTTGHEQMEASPSAVGAVGGGPENQPAESQSDVPSVAGDGGVGGGGA